MIPPCEGGPGPPSPDVLAFEASADATEPIGRVTGKKIPVQHGNRDRNTTLQALEAMSPIIRAQMSPKKRRLQDDSTTSQYTQGIADIIERAVGKALRECAAAQPRCASIESGQNVCEMIEKSVQQMTKETAQMMSDAIAKMQAEVEKKAEAVFKRLFEQTLKTTPIEVVSSNTATRQPQLVDLQEARKKQQGALNPGKTATQTWAERFNPKTQEPGEWKTVSGRKKPTGMKKVLKKHPIDQRRVLFVRQDQTQNQDPRDIMLAINKALTQHGVDTTIRLAGLRYTRKGHLSGITVEHSRAEDLIEHAAIVIAAAGSLDPGVIEMEKTEKWRKMRVHGVSLDRYLSEGGLETAREEIESTTGELLPYAPRWIRSETLEERFHSGTVNHSTMVVTVKSKQAADAIMANGLQFGGRRHEAEKFWMKGEGGICLQCCGRDHFGKCTETAKCYVCAEQHEGANHRCKAKDCGKKSLPCEHHAAKCANCGGQHMATSPRCPEKRKQMQPGRKDAAEPRSREPDENTNVRTTTDSRSANREQSERASSENTAQFRSTPPLPKSLTINPPDPSSEGDIVISSDGDVEMSSDGDVEMSPPTPTPNPRRPSTPSKTSSDDSATT